MKMVMGLLGLLFLAGCSRAKKEPLVVVDGWWKVGESYA